MPPTQLAQQAKPAKVRTMSQGACLRLVARESLGRVGLVAQGGVQIIPVGYRLGVGPRVFVSACRWGVLAQLGERGVPCSFEVDHHPTDDRPGWSVLMQGVLTRLDRAGVAAYANLVRALDPCPGHEDARPVQFIPYTFSGRSDLHRF
jgi:nitroimidazol reductase NimA-like FMN-containing flavoprotein (pyridoxamine 5'-phosphate oxidase superfamily)